MPILVPWIPFCSLTPSWPLYHRAVFEPWLSYSPQPGTHDPTVVVYMTHFYFLFPIASKLCCWGLLSSPVAQEECTLRSAYILSLLSGDLSQINPGRQMGLWWFISIQEGCGFMFPLDDCPDASTLVGPEPQQCCAGWSSVNLTHKLKVSKRRGPKVRKCLPKLWL